MASQKTIVIEYLFNMHWDEESGELKKSIMTLQDVAEAIRACNEASGQNLQSNNPANFMKDLLRGANASKNWPESVAQKRYTAEQRTGTGDCFEFVPYQDAQIEPFPEAFKVNLKAQRIQIQSISLPAITKSLGRSDETWLIQTAINLRVVETHFAVAAAHRMIELSHLQMGIKLKATEIDALFLGKSGNISDVQADLNALEPILITCEAKQSKDPFITSQIIQQVRAAFETTNLNCVVPIGLKAIKNVGFYLVEFEEVRRGDLGQFDELSLASEAIYELVPSVPGI